MSKKSVKFVKICFRHVIIIRKYRGRTRITHFAPNIISTAEKERCKHMAAFVELKHITKVYKMGEVEIRAVDGIDFEIEKGELVVIVGPSGAGKTTVLNILGGMDTATSGKIIVDGADITRYNERQLTSYRRDDIGFVFQFYNLVPNLTAKENVELALQICKDPLDAQTVLEDVGLGKRLDNFPAQLSGGEQQRVIDRAGACEESETTAVRRTDRSAGLQYRKGNLKTASGYVQEKGDDGDHHHA